MHVLDFRRPCRCVVGAHSAELRGSLDWRFVDRRLVHFLYFVVFFVVSGALIIRITATRLPRLLIMVMMQIIYFYRRGRYCLLVAAQMEV